MEYQSIIDGLAVRKPFDVSGFPIYLAKQNEFYLAKLNSVDCLIVAPTERQSLPDLKKIYAAISKLVSYPVVLELASPAKYVRDKLVAYGIPFISGSNMIFLPFVGTILMDSVRDVEKKAELSFIAQKVLLTALYERWDGTSIADAANRLGVSGMSVSRAYDDIEGVGLPFIRRNGRIRLFLLESGVKEYWDAIEPHLRNPVKKVFRIAGVKCTEDVRLGGMSALCRYTMLADNMQPTYAIHGVKLADIASRYEIVPKEAECDAELQVMAYMINYGDGVAVDPVSAYLSLSEQDMSDPRIEKEWKKIIRRLTE
jgi:hypothetical protein